MAGNKHKNGIVCVFPGCEKKMRTQKFKGHFVKAHLREGEEYTVDHRRQYEVAQSEPLPDSDAASASASPMDLMGTGTGLKPVKTEQVKRASLDAAKKATDALMAGVVNHPGLAMAQEAVRSSESDEEELQPTQATAELPVQQEELQPAPIAVQATAEMVESAPMAVLPLAATQVAPVAAPVAAPAAAPAPVRAAKRPAAAISSDAVVAPNDIQAMEDSTMVKMLLLMDRRFNELAHKMDEMMEMQRLLFSAIMTKDSVAVAVDEHAAKKRKDSTSSTIV